MAGGVTVHGLTALQRKLQDKAKRVRDLSPALKVVARQLEKASDDAFRQKKSPAGEPWPALKESTKLGRVRNLKAAGKRTKSGGLTKGAQKLRAALLAPGGIQPLVDKGILRNSIRVRVKGKRSAQWSAIGYAAPHMTGGKSGNPPQRNMAPFEWDGSRWALVPAERAKAVKTLRRYVETGRA